MADASLDILVLSDLHYVREAEHVCSIEERQSFLGPVLLHKALARLRHEGVEVGLVALLGDVVDDGLAAGAEQDLAAIARATHELGIPVLAVPGNHDGEPGRLARIFGCPPGLNEIDGYGFLLFHDHVAEGHVTTRPAQSLTLPEQVAAGHPGLPLIALQHNPLHPAIESDYPFLLTNADQVLQGYQGTGVILSLSGHYHPGQPAHRVGDVTCYTAPAACEAPFRFAHVHLQGREVAVREHSLHVDAPQDVQLVDVHCHTEYAYCGKNVDAASNIQISRAMGLHGLCLVEHSFQLYFDETEAWGYRWQTDPDLVRRAWQEGWGRMDEYREVVRGLRDGYVRLGLEVELCRDGSLMLKEEDRQGWDLFIGAIHQLPGFEKGRTTQTEAEALFLRDTERLLAHPIQVLAHPFRFFRRSGLERPAHLYEPVVERLARAGVAAEVNFHTNEPDPRFVRACIERGVRIALASDSHVLAEVGEFAPHLALLRQVGVRDVDLPDVLYQPE